MVSVEAFNIANVLRIFIVLTLSFFVTMILTPFWIRFMKNNQNGKQIKPKEDTPIFQKLHQHKEGTPTAGGVIIWGSVVLIMLVFSFLANTVDGFWSRVDFLSRTQTWLPLGALIFAGVLGLIDDFLGMMRRGPNGGGLRMKLKVFLYLLIGIIGAWWFYSKLGFDSINIPFHGDIVIGPWYVLFFIFIIISSTFSANETDGLDGLSGGVLLTMFGAYGAIAFSQGRMDLVVFIGAIIGSLVAFLWYNIFPAKLFMGDTGAMSLGVVLGIIAMLTNTPFLLIPIGIVFILESGSVVLQVISKRFRNGKKIFLSTPIHHHFEAKGFHETTITMRLWMVSVLGAIIGVIIFLIDSKLPPLF